MQARVLVVNPSGTQSLDLIGRALLEAGAWFDEITTQDAIDQLAAGRPLSTQVRVVTALPQTSGEFDGMIVLGLPCDSCCLQAGRILPSDAVVSQIETLLQVFHADKKPLLGICFGALLIAHAFGGTVHQMPVDQLQAACSGREVGWLAQDFTRDAWSDPLLAPALRAWLQKGALPQGPAAVKFFHAGGAALELPPSATALCTRPASPTEAFRLGSSAYGFQFHFQIGQETAVKCCEGSSALDEALRAELTTEVAQGTVRRAEAFALAFTQAWIALAFTARASSRPLMPDVVNPDFRCSTDCSRSRSRSRNRDDSGAGQLDEADMEI